MYIIKEQTVNTINYFGLFFRIVPYILNISRGFKLKHLTIDDAFLMIPCGLVILERKLRSGVSKIKIGNLIFFVLDVAKTCFINPRIDYKNQLEQSFRKINKWSIEHAYIKKEKIVSFPTLPLCFQSDCRTHFNNPRLLLVIFYVMLKKKKRAAVLFRGLKTRGVTECF